MPPDEQTTTTGEGNAAQPQGFRGTATGEPVGTPAVPPPSTSLADPPVVGHRGQEMSPEAIAERVARHERKVLRDHYGTDDPTQIAEIRKRNAEREERIKKFEEQEAARAKKDEEAKRAKMTREQQLQADVDAKNKRIADLENELKGAKNDVLVEKQDQIVTQAMVRHVDPEMMAAARFMLSQAVRAMSPTEQKRFDAKKLDAWIAKFVKDNPKYAKVVETAPAETPAANKSPPPPARKVPVGAPRRTNGQAPPKPAAPASGNLSGKTPKPGHPNSMNRVELADYLTPNNLRHW